LSHSHISPINHLLKQVELHRARKAQRDLRPQWLTQFIDDVIDLFDPMSDVARVGFDARLEEFWRVSLYLGNTELVGGSEDGLAKHTNFEFDVLGLLDRFAHLDQFSWTAIPEPSAVATANCCWLTAIGTTQKNQKLHLDIFSIPPKDAGPGLHVFPNGDHRSV
jgi:hypothetical protein